MSDKPVADIKLVQTVDPSAAPVTETSPRPSAPIREEPKGMVPEPVAAEPVPQPSASNLPPVTSGIAREAAEKGLKIVDAERDGGDLYLVVEGDHVEDIQGGDGRKLAYDARFHYGFANAGIEAHAGSVPVGNGRFRQTWKLIRGI